MYTIDPTKIAFKELKQQIFALFPDFLHVPDSSLNESIARALTISGKSFHTYASLLAFIKNAGTGPTNPSLMFNRVAFLSRLKDLMDSTLVDSIDVLMQGATIDIDIQKHDIVHQRTDVYSDIAYHVSVAVTGIASELLNFPQTFLLPHFGKLDVEPYRVDSASYHRTDIEGYTVTRNRGGRQCMAAKLINGRWKGGLYIYSPSHMQDDSQCIKSVKMGLLRAILPGLTSQVNCLIFRPDRYEHGAWRIQINLGSDVKDFLGPNTLTFNLPDLESRLLIPEPQSRVDVRKVKFESGFWSADLYSNGVAEDVNPTTIEKVKSALLFNVQKQLNSIGYSY